MSSKNLGRYIRKTQEDAEYNAKRAAEEFPLPERSVHSFSAANPFFFEFNSPPTTGARLSFKVEPHPDVCSISEAVESINCSARHVLDASTGHFVSFYYNNGGFAINSAGEIIIPRDGCYDLSFFGGVGGVITGDFSQHITTALIHNGVVVRSDTAGATGYIAILGPLIPTYTAPTPLYARIGAKAGDTIQVGITQLDTTTGTPWFGGHLGGFWIGESTLNIQLVGLADG